MTGVTGLIGAIAEAWQELRVHRMRVLLSLVGVAVSVAALTWTLAMGQMLQQSQDEQLERSSGRPAMVHMSAFPIGDPGPAEGTDPAAMTEAVEATVDRYGIDWSSRVGYVDALAMGMNAALEAVDADYGEMHRVEISSGRWFAEADARRLVPTVIINEWWWEQVGAPPLDTHPTVAIGAVGTTLDAIVVGVVPSGPYDEYPRGYMLYDDAQALTASSQGNDQPPMYEAWIPLDNADELMDAIRSSIQAHLGEGVEVAVDRVDYLAWQSGNPMLVMQLVIGSIAAVVLLIGALSLLNITLVTVRYRIREIGVRRSFGATAGRVFFSVMLESVVGTVLAGIVGIALAVVAMRIPIVEQGLFAGIQDVPPFPMGAAVMGLGVSVGVGALAGLLPALVAVRVSPIDAIRY